MSVEDRELRPDGAPLRRGWTTGACATAAARSATAALLAGAFEDPVTITLPGGQRPSFALAHEARGNDFAEAGIIKDAGDDPDVTHGALILAQVVRGEPGAGVTFHAGPGVGTVTKPGLPLAVGEPAINPVPRRMIAAEIGAVAADHGAAADLAVTISVPNGEALAQKTWNPRLGILGGLSILGTTGIVIPYSCSAWIESIRRGVDVARALGLDHIVGATGDRSEKAAMARLRLPIEAYIDLGDFVGGLLKYVRVHPVDRVTIAGGFAKLCKLMEGAMDLHSARGTVDLPRLAERFQRAGGAPERASAMAGAGSANEALGIGGAPLAAMVVSGAAEAAQRIAGPRSRVDILVVDRDGRIVAESG
jgi:cobalt-precorrin-5B (C1)-methyltransferase